jgi:deoxyribodipyrimidine photo-lyase
VAQDLSGLGIAFSDYKDQVLLDRDEVLTQQGQPYSVFTPYKRAWLQKLDAFQLKPYPVALYARHLAPIPVEERLPALEQLGFERTNLQALPMPAGMDGAQQLLQDFLPRMHAYQEARDFPGARVCPICPCTCALARCPSGRWQVWPCSVPCKGMRAHRPGCPSWPGVISTS